MKRKNKKLSVFSIISVGILSIYTILLLGMLVWAFISSFKADLDFQWEHINPFPDKRFGWHFENYLTAYNIMYVATDLPNGGTRYVRAAEMFLNSTIWSVGSAFLNTFVVMITAFVCASFSRRTISKIIYGAVVVAISLPIVGSLPSQLKMATDLRIYDTVWVMVLMKTTFASSYFLVFYALFLKTPRAYREAAELDGAGNWTIYFKIYFPMVMNSAIAVFLLLFIGYWNDYATPMLFWPSRPTISQGLYEFQNSRHRLANDPVKFAGSFLVCIPSLAVFLIFREKIMNNVTMGGLKG